MWEARLQTCTIFRIFLLLSLRLVIQFPINLQVTGISQSLQQHPRQASHQGCGLQHHRLSLVNTVVFLFRESQTICEPNTFGPVTRQNVMWCKLIERHVKEMGRAAALTVTNCWLFCSRLLGNVETACSKTERNSQKSYKVHWNPSLA